MKSIGPIISALLLLPILALGPIASGAQKKNANKKSGKNKTLTKAAATKAQTAAKKRLRDAQTALRKAEKDFSSTRKTVSGKHLKATGVAGAQNGLKLAQANAVTIRKAVVNRLHERTDFISVSEDAKKAGVELRALSTRGKISAERKRERRAELSSVVRQPVLMEQEALADDPRYEQMMGELRKATTAQTQALEKYGRLVANDPAMKRVTKAYGDAKKELASATGEVQQATRQLQAAARAEAQQQRQEQAKTRQQQTSKKKGKKKGKGNNNNKKKKK
jgi:hypothetical protein